MDASITKYKWFFPWQDEKEEAWLEAMSREGKHLTAVHLPCAYDFEEGQPRPYTYRMDYMLGDKQKLGEYFQIFQDAGWEYIGEMSNWRYWRKLTTAGETPEIFTDRGSKIKKYQRLLLIMTYFLMFVSFFGIKMFQQHLQLSSEYGYVISGFHLSILILYAVLIPIYIVVVVKLLIRIRQLKQKSL